MHTALELLAAGTLQATPALSPVAICGPKCDIATVTMSSLFIGSNLRLPGFHWTALHKRLTDTVAAGLSLVVFLMVLTVDLLLPQGKSVSVGGVAWYDLFSFRSG